MLYEFRVKNACFCCTRNFKNTVETVFYRLLKREDIKIIIPRKNQYPEQSVTDNPEKLSVHHL